MNTNEKETLGNGVNFKEFDRNSNDPNVGDDFFPIVLDYLIGIKPEVKGLQISSTKKSQEGNKRLYKIEVIKKNGQKATFTLNLNLETIVISLEQE